MLLLTSLGNNSMIFIYKSIPIVIDSNTPIIISFDTLKSAIKSPPIKVDNAINTTSIVYFLLSLYVVLLIAIPRGIL